VIACRTAFSFSISAICLIVATNLSFPGLLNKNADTSASILAATSGPVKSPKVSLLYEPHVPFWKFPPFLYLSAFALTLLLHTAPA
jgi:hypothetical protein